MTTSTRTQHACLFSAMADNAITGWQIERMFDRHADHVRRINAAQERVARFLDEARKGMEWENVT